MKRRKICWRIACSFVVGLAVICSSSSLASEAGELAAARVSQANYRHYLDDMLYTHAGDDRGLYGDDHDAARDNIFMLFGGFGLDVTLHAFDFEGDTFYNVVATMSGTVYPDREYIIGAHFDSGDAWPGGGNAGADDDASGIALILETARVLSAYESDYTIRFIAFDAEEWGLIGSYAYVDDHLGDDVQAMIAADMVAYNGGEDAFRLLGGDDSDPLRSALGGAIGTYGLGLSVHPRPGSATSDHWPFEAAGFQACHLIEFAPNSYIHTADDNVDTPDYIDYGYATRITRSVVGFLVDIAGVSVTVPDADFDADGDVDLADADAFAKCYGGPDTPVEPLCDFFDFEDDGDVDCSEWRLFEVVWTDAGHPPVFRPCPPMPLPPTSASAGGRCLTLSAPTHARGWPIALLVAGDSGDPTVGCLSEYIQPDGHLGSAPFFQTHEEWNTIVVCDEKLVPGTAYRAHADYGEPQLPLLSPHRLLTTSRWGDIVGDFVQGQWTPPNGVVDFRDISSVVDAFRHLPVAPPAHQVELVGSSGTECSPDLNIDFLDISAAVEAFKGHSYWATTSCPMPCD